MVRTTWELILKMAYICYPTRDNLGPSLAAFTRPALRDDPTRSRVIVFIPAQAYESAWMYTCGHLGWSGEVENGYGSLVTLKIKEMSCSGGQVDLRINFKSLLLR